MNCSFGGGLVKQVSQSQLFLLLTIRFLYNSLPLWRIFNIDRSQ